MEVIKYIGVICATWLFTTGSAPIEFIKEFFNVSEDSEPKDRLRKVISSLINCNLCSGFWIGLAVYQNLWMACIISISAEIFGRVWDKYGA